MILLHLALTQIHFLLTFFQIYLKSVLVILSLPCPSVQGALYIPLFSTSLRFIYFRLMVMLSFVCMSVSVCVSFPFFPGSFLFVSFSRDSLNYGKISFNSSDVVLLNFSHNKFHGTLPTYAFVSIAIPSFVDANTIPSTLVSPFNYSLWIWSKSAVSCLNFKFNNFDCPLPGYCSASCSGKATNVCDNKPGEACGILPCGMNSSTSTLSRSLSLSARVCVRACVFAEGGRGLGVFSSLFFSLLSRELIDCAWYLLLEST